MIATIIQINKCNRSCFGSIALVGW